MDDSDPLGHYGPHYDGRLRVGKLFQTKILVLG